jgi:hypothetical protein
MVECSGGFTWEANNHCYTRYPKTATSLSGQALQYCHGLSAHVVTFASEQEYEQVVAALGNNQPFWVGLLPVLAQGPDEYIPFAAFEPGWSPVCSGCFAHSADASAPLPGAPGCIEAPPGLDASWQQVSCTDAGKVQVICEREPVGPTSDRCDAGICIEIPWTYGTKRYVYRPPATAQEAEQQCASLGGTLVVLQSRDEREQLWRELSRMPAQTPGSLAQTPGSLWIGLSYGDAGWIWDDDAGVDAYAAVWAENAPNSTGTQARIIQNQTTSAPTVEPDNTLANNDALTDGAATETRIGFVCQILIGVDGGTDAGDAGDASEGGENDASDGGTE